MDNYNSIFKKNAIAIVVALVFSLGLFFLLRTDFYQTPQEPAKNFEETSSEEELLLDTSKEISPDTIVVSDDRVETKEEYPKQATIGLKSWSDLERAKQIIIDNGGNIVNIYNWPDKNVIVAEIPSKEAEEAMLKNSFWAKIVGAVGFSDYGNELSGGIDYIEEDPDVHFDGQLADWGLAKIQIQKVWDISGRGRGVNIGIIDSGIQIDHPDLTANIKGGCSFIIGESGCEQEKWAYDTHGHGTKMAGIIGAVDNNIGVVGVAPESNIYVLKTIEPTISSSVSQSISAIYWAADNGIDVLNMSIGSDLRNYPNTRLLYQDAINYAINNGVTLVGSTGNDGRTPEGNYVGWPAAAENVIAIGAIDADNQIAEFSSYGPEVDFVAPGVQILTTEIGSTYAFGSGTSDAAPYVTGVIANMISHDPALTQSQIKGKLIATALDLGAPGKDDYYGYGLVNGFDSVVSRLAVTLNIISPEGRQQWFKGTQQKIEWSDDSLSSETKIEKVDIELVYEHSGVIEEIPLLLNTPNTGSAFVNIPLDLTNSDFNNRYNIKISCSVDYLGECISDKSGLIVIYDSPPQKLTIKKPTGGELWPSGSVQTILWDANYFGGMGINVSLLEKKLIPNYIPQVTEISSLIYNGVFSRKCVLPDGYCYGGIWNIVNSFKKPNGKYAFTWSPPPVDTCNGDLNNTVSTAFDCSGLSQERVAQDAIDLDGDGIYQLSCVDAIKSTNNSYNWESLLTCNFELDPSKTVKAQVHPSYECVNKDSDPGYCLESAGYSLVNFIDQPEGQSFRWNLAPPPIDTCDGNITNNLDNKFNCSNLSVGYYDGDYFAVNPETNLVNNLSDKDGDGVFEFNCRDAAQSNDFDLSKPKWFQSNVTCFYEPDQNSSIEVFEEISLLAGNTANNGEVTISIPSGLSGSDYQVQLDCSYFQGECIRGLSEPIVIDNIFDPVTLTINKFGEGSVVDNNTVCGDTRGFCSNIYERGSVVTLIPIAPDTTSIFAGWTGNNSCFGTGPCELVMDGNQSVNAIFSRRAVTLLAIPNIGSVFKGWSGECLETGQCFVSDSEECTTDIPCAITFGSDQAVSAEFVESPVLTVNISGAGTGTVVGKNINCSEGTCERTYESGEPEILEVFPGPDSTFNGWFGNCEGFGTCDLIMDEGKVIFAAFGSDANSGTGSDSGSCPSDNWTCTEWLPLQCPESGEQQRFCTPDCSETTSSSPPTTQSCSSGFEPGEIKEVKPGN